MAGLELDSQARDLAAKVVKGNLTAEVAAAQAGVTVEAVNQWVTAYISEAKASFEARAKSLLSQTKAGMLSPNPSHKPAPPPPARVAAPPAVRVPAPATAPQAPAPRVPAPPSAGAAPPPPSLRVPLPAPTPFQSQVPVHAAPTAPAASRGTPPRDVAYARPAEGSGDPSEEPTVLTRAADLFGPSSPAAISDRARSATGTGQANAAVAASLPVTNTTPPGIWPSQLAVPEVNYPLPKPISVGVAYSGSIDKDSLIDAARSLASLQQSGILRVHTGTEESTIHIDSGEIIDAQWRDLRGQEALWRVFDTAKGTFEVEGYSPPRDQSIESPASALLTEAHRRLSIARQLKKHLGSAQQVFSLNPITKEQLATVGKIEPQLLTLFDGKRTLKQVVAESVNDEFTTLSQVQRLHDRGFLVPTSLRPVEVPAAPELSVSPPAARSRSEIPSELPFKKRRAGRWLGAGAVAFGGMLAGLLFVAEGSFSPDAAADALARWSAALSSGDESPSARAAALAAQSIGSIAPFAAPSPAARAASDVQPPSCPEGMSYIAPGRFSMGTRDDSPALAAAQPEHHVELKAGYCLDRVEVTVEAYQRCVDQNKCSAASSEARWPPTEAGVKAWEASLVLHGKQCNGGARDRGAYPVNCISWEQAKTYCETLGQRLPTEVEWEFAARGEEGRLYPWGSAAPRSNLLNACGKECTAWHESVGLQSQIIGELFTSNDGFAGTAPAGAFGLGATPEGILDLAGNVSEWTANAPYEYTSGDATPASRPTDGELHMIRGGAYNSGAPEFVHAAFRFSMPNNTLSPSIGFRCASSP